MCEAPSGPCGQMGTVPFFRAPEPGEVDVARAVDQMRRRTAGAGQLRQPLAVRAILAADDQHHVGSGGELPHRLLTVLRGVADVVPRRADDLRQFLPQPLDDLRGIINGERRLRKIGHLGWVGHFQRVNIGCFLHQADRLRRLAHRADHLVVPRVPDQQDRVSLPGEAYRFEMDLGYQRAGHVEGLQTPRGRLFSDFRRHAMRGIEQMLPLGHFRQIVHEDDPPPPEKIDYPFIVDDLMVDVQRRAVGGDGQFQGRGRHVHARAESSWLGRNDPHGSLTRSNTS